MAPIAPYEMQDVLQDGAPEPTPFGPQSEVPADWLKPLTFEVDDRTGADSQFEIDDKTGEILEVHPEDDLMPAARSAGFAENLAEQLEDRELSAIANNLIEEVELDVSAREPWTSRFKNGMAMMGLIDDEVDDGPFPGASTAVMPIISEATVQFWARSMGEQVPAEGPFKGQVLGDSSDDLIQRSDRVSSYMNHEAMLLDKGWYHEHSRLLWALPWQGTCMKKIYRDRVLGRNVSIYVAAEDFIINHAFSDLESAPRFTHRIWRTHNEIKKEQVAGVYRDVPLARASVEELTEEQDIKLEIQDTEQSDDIRDSRHELYEVYCELDLPGFEDKNERGEPTGIALPYIVTLDRETHVVLSIYRGWKEQDPLKRRRMCFVPYNFVPGVGFYALGFFHLIGGLQAAATGALRLIIDGAATASLQGGFVGNDAAIRDQELTLEPGVYKKVQAPSETIAKAFYTPQFKEPSPVLEKVLGILIDRSEKFAATTETATGDTDPKNAPVGSTVAMIEQSQKVFSTIHRGLHMSLAAEARIRYELIQEYMPQEGYPYDVDGQHEGVMMEDFAPGVNVVPVSDPNIFSAVQRNAMNDAVYQLAMQNPQVIRVPVALKRVLEGMKVPDIEELMVETTPPPPMDPVGEIQALLRGEPVQAYPDQMHVEHLQHLAAFIQNPQYGANQMIQEQIGANLAALVGQHAAYAWAAHARGLGTPAPLAPPVMGDPQAQTDPNQAGGTQPGFEPQMPGLGPDGMPQLAPPGVDPRVAFGAESGNVVPFGPQMAGQGEEMGRIPPQMPPEQIEGNLPMDGTGQEQQPPVPTGAPPEVVAQIAAQIAPAMAQVPGLPAVDGGDGGEQGKIEVEREKAQIKREESQAKLQMEEQKHQQKMSHEQQMAELKQQVEEMKAQAKIREIEMKGQIAEMQAQQEAQFKQRQMEQEAQLNEQQMAQRAQEAEQQAALNAQQMQLNNAQAQNDMAISTQEGNVRARAAAMSASQSDGNDDRQPAPKKGSKRSKKK